MSGIDRRTGTIIDNFASACQSLETIFATPIGERVMRRQFGGGIVELLGRLMRPDLFPVVMILIAAAIDVWEPRFRVRSVRFTGSVDAVRAGQAGIAIEVDWRPDAHRGDFTIEGTRAMILRYSGRRWVTT